MTQLVLPTALPYVMTGLRLAAAVALILAITAEMVIGNPGLGRMIELSRSAGDAAGLYALVVVTGLLGLAVNARLPARRAPGAVLAPVGPRGGGAVTAYHRPDSPRTPRRRGGRLPIAASRAARARAAGAAAAWSGPWWPTRRDEPVLSRPADHRPTPSSTPGSGPRSSTDVLPSLARLGIGIVASIVVGIAAGTVIGLTAVAAGTPEPVLEFFRAIPPPVLIPVMMLLLGITDTMKVVVIVSGAVWPILLNTIEGVRATDSVMTETARLVPDHLVAAAVVPVLPAASPRIMAGVRQALSVALILMVISEMFASSSGLGYRIVYFQRNFLIAEMWSGIVLLGLIGVLPRRALRARRTPRPALVPRNAGGRSVPDTEAPCCGSSSLRKVYEHRRRATSRRSRDLSFTMDAGELVCIVGPSGCGKTTLLKCIAGLLRPTGGEVALDGAPVTGPPPTMAVVFQEYGRSLFPWLTVRGNVELPLRHKRLSRARAGPLVDDALEAVGLAHAARSLPVAALRRHAAAGGDRPRHRLPARGAAHGRAVRRGGRADPGRPGGPGPSSLARSRGVIVLFVTHDIDESVYLGQRVLVLSTSPTRGPGGPGDRPARRSATRSPPAPCPASPNCAPTSTSRSSGPRRGADMWPRGPRRDRAGRHIRRRARQWVVVSRGNCCFAFFGEHVLDDDTGPIRASVLITRARRGGGRGPGDPRHPRPARRAAASSNAPAAAGRSCSR